MSDQEQGFDSEWGYIDADIPSAFLLNEGESLGGLKGPGIICRATDERSNWRPVFIPTSEKKYVDSGILVKRRWAQKNGIRLFTWSDFQRLQEQKEQAMEEAQKRIEEMEFPGPSFSEHMKEGLKETVEPWWEETKRGFKEIARKGLEDMWREITGGKKK